jgi:hypothetical protein
MKQVASSGSACYLLYGLLPALFFNPEDEGNMFLS